MECDAIRQIGNATNAGPSLLQIIHPFPQRIRSAISVVFAGAVDLSPGTPLAQVADETSTHHRGGDGRRNNQIYFTGCRLLPQAGKRFEIPQRLQILLALPAPRESDQNSSSSFNNGNHYHIPVKLKFSKAEQEKLLKQVQAIFTFRRLKRVIAHPVVIHYRQIASPSLLPWCG